MSLPALPGDGRGRLGPANGRPEPQPDGVEAAGKAGVAEAGQRGSLDDNIVLTVLVTVQLTFVLLMAVWTELTTTQALQAAIGATTIAVLAVHGKSMLLAIGRRLFGDQNSRGGA